MSVETDQNASCAPDALAYSVVVPFYNEREVARKVYDRISRVMRHIGRSYEIVLVNDGSSDGTADVLEQIVRQDPKALLVDLRRNFGQATAIQAGFDYTRGQVIIVMDGDLQHDPYEIPLFIRKIDEGYDIASGWRVRRGDNLLLRRLPSRVANRLLAWVSGVELHDFGTTFKAYRREMLEGIRLYGDMHRFVPAVCARLGARICEVPIKNVRRQAGKSNYGLSRTFRVLMDLLTLELITRYYTRPLHFFGRFGLVGLIGGFGILAYGLARKLIDWNFALFVRHGPLMLVGFILVITGMLLLATGLIGELLMRIYFEATSARTYAVRRTIRGAGLTDER